MLLWWTSRQCTAITRNQAESCKGSSVTERPAQMQSYVNQTVLTSKLNLNAITLLMLNDAFVRRTTDLEKTVNINWLFISLSVTTIADAFLHKSDIWAHYQLRVWAHYQLSALWHNLRKEQEHTREQQMHPPKVPPKAQVYRTGVPNLSLTMHPFSISTYGHVPLKFLMTKRLSKTTKIHWSFDRTFRILEQWRQTPFLCLKLNLLQMYNELLFQIRKCTFRGTCTPGWEPLL